jgi:acetolactate synthase-1/2/3 large subunit
MNITGAELVSRFLEQAGVGLVAMAPSTAAPLRRALESLRVQKIAARSEQGAAFIAQGHAHADGRAAICTLGSGVAVTDIATALADAQASAVPLLCLASHAAADQMPMGFVVDRITKAHFEAGSVAELALLLPEALRIAESGRKGPVLIAFAELLLMQQLEIAEIPSRLPPLDPVAQPRPRRESSGDVAPMPSRSLLAAITRLAGMRPVCAEPRGFEAIGTDGAFLRSAVGARGAAIPLAIGLALAHPEHGALCLVDEAGMLASAHELATLAELDLDVKLVVVGDSAPRLSRMAGAFGVPAIDLLHSRDARAALRRAFASPGPVLMDAGFGAAERPRAAIPAAGAFHAALTGAAA